MNRIINEIKDSFKAGNFLTKLIYINAGVFVVVKLALLICNLTGVSTSWLLLFELPAHASLLRFQPWTVITYMFLHVNFLHLLFNLIALYYFGQLFLQFFSQKQLVAVYIWGGLAGALAYIASFMVFRTSVIDSWVSYLLGASASVMAILFAAVGHAPHYKVRLALIGEVKLLYIGIFFLAIDLLGINSITTGTVAAHVGGAVMGYLFAYFLQKGTDLSLPITRCIDWVVNHWPQNLFTGKKRMKVTVNHTANMSDAQWNKQQKEQAIKRQERIDQILDKIKTSGYQNLTDEEKKSLFDLSKDPS